MGKYASEQEIKERQTFTEKAKALGIDRTTLIRILEK